MIVPRTNLIACLAVLAGVVALAPSKAQAQCGDGGYYQPATTYYEPQTYYAPPTQFAPQTYYAPPQVVYYGTPRVYRSYSASVNVGHGHYYRGHRDGHYARDYRHGGGHDGSYRQGGHSRAHRRNH